MATKARAKKSEQNVKVDPTPQASVSGSCGFTIERDPKEEFERERRMRLAAEAAERLYKGLILDVIDRLAASRFG